jgi:large subunit ribosomal protein L33
VSERTRIVLVCEECGGRNYPTTKAVSKRERLSIKKYCPTCKRHTVHKESK